MQGQDNTAPQRMSGGQPNQECCHFISSLFAVFQWLLGLVKGINWGDLTWTSLSNQLERNTETRNEIYYTST